MYISSNTSGMGAWSGLTGLNGMGWITITASNLEGKPTPMSQFIQFLKEEWIHIVSASLLAIKLCDVKVLELHQWISSSMW